MSTILITGASSGVGLAFLESFSTASMTHKIITADIRPLPATLAPNILQASSITHHILDIRSEISIIDFAREVHAQSIDLVIHSIGVRGLVDDLHTTSPGSAQEAETLQAMDMATLMSTFQINTAGAFLLFRSLLPSLRLSSRTTGTAPKVIVMTSRMGSMAANTAGSGYAYRASKAALNAVVKSLSIDVPEVVWVLCHPGRVESGLVKYKEEGAISGQESVRGLVPLIERWDSGDSGKFYDRFGEKIDW